MKGQPRCATAMPRRSAHNHRASRRSGSAGATQFAGEPYQRTPQRHAGRRRSERPVSSKDAGPHETEHGKSLKHASQSGDFTSRRGHDLPPHRRCTRPSAPGLKPPMVPEGNGSDAQRSAPVSDCFPSTSAARLLAVRSRRPSGITTISRGTGRSPGTLPPAEGTDQIRAEIDAKGSA